MLKLFYDNTTGVVLWIGDNPSQLASTGVSSVVLDDPVMEKDIAEGGIATVDVVTFAVAVAAVAGLATLATNITADEVKITGVTTFADQRDWMAMEELHRRGITPGTGHPT